MKNINILLSTLLLLTISQAQAQTTTCDGSGKSNGSECHFIDCECASDVCFNGICVQCASDADCPDSQSCIENTCH